MAPKQKTEAELRYPIGVVARRTGIHPETIRIWERRYAVVTPERPGSGRRLYSEEDVRRLELVKKLVDAGHPVGQVAHLPTPTLLTHISQATAARAGHPVGTEMGTCRIVAVGESLPARLDHERSQLGGIELVAAWRDPSKVKIDERKGTPDVVLIEAASVHAGSLTDVEILRARTGARAAVLVFGFGARRLIEELEREGVQCLQSPVTAAELRRACFAVCGRRDASGPTVRAADVGRRFDPDQLARIASLASTLACECPRHLADLINSLIAFESYSSDCQISKPADAVVHAMLRDRAAAARALLETGLMEVLQQEGITV